MSRACERGVDHALDLLKSFDGIKLCAAVNRRRKSALVLDGSF
jgi:hypothetical protein